MSPKKSLEMHCSVTFYFKLSDREVPSNGGTGIILKPYQTQNSHWRKDGGKNNKHTTQKKKKKTGHWSSNEIIFIYCLWCLNLGEIYPLVSQESLKTTSSLTYEFFIIK